MQKWAEPFYKSTAWKQTRKAYRQSVGGLCERCKEKGIIKAGVIVHHKVYLTQENITDPEISLSFDNLMLVCRDCHAELHKRLKRYKVDEFGQVTARG